MAIGRKAVIENEAEEELILQLKNSYAALYEIDDNFSEFIEEAREETVLALREKYAGRMIQQPAPDITLEKLDGDPLTLSELRRKFIVLDFWATWCGPCVRSFPHFQRVVDYFDDNSDVIFLAIIT